MKTRIISIIRKEFIHIIRDPRSLLIVILMPVLMIVLYGYAFNTDIKDIETGVIDYNQSALSRKLLDTFFSSEYFTPAANCQSMEQIEDLIKSRRIRVALIIPKAFDKSVRKNFATPVQVIIDGSDSQAATIIQNYVSTILSGFISEISQVQIQLPIDVRYQFWYNPELKTAHFFVPGLIAMILVMISALLTCITIAREKEMGTLEQILVSPIHPYEIVIGKVVPYIVLAFIDGLLILVVGYAWFNVPFEGSLVQLMLLSLVYIYTALSFGLVISTVVPSLRVAMLMTLAITLMPTVLLSGFIFPIESMPPVLRWITFLVPACYFLKIIRGILLKGIGIEALWQQMLILFCMGTFFMIASAKRFKSRLE
ncbi:ABC transporter permease [candidate division KSB1 bacterium]|nr:ABC transporter permease [candidate division KSB1 bacterium]